MTKLTEAAETVLSRRYYLKDEKGNPVEDWADLCNRVAMHVGQDEESNIVNQFFGMIHNLDFLPNSPCLMNAGTELGQLSACFVLPVEDSMDGIFSAVRNGALVHKTGGGTGYSFSRLRPKGSSVLSTQGVASGPLSFLEVFNTATETIKQGGKRRGANMAVLDIEHPDIEEFIKAKEDPTRFTNFNFSVAITDGFMEAVTNPVVAAEKELHLFDLIVDRAWRTGEPGVIFIDRVNEANPTPWLGKIEASNPCWSGDTRVWTIDGPRRFDELAAAGRDVLVLTQDAEGRLIWRTMRSPRMTRAEAPLVRVSFDNGTSVECTPDHNLYLRSGIKVRAGDLKPGDRISSVYRHKANSKGYLKLSNGEESVVEHHVNASAIYGRRPDYPREHCHHRDGDKTNNHPSNLEIIPSKKHNREEKLGGRNPMAGVWDERNTLFGRDVSGPNNPRYRADIVTKDLVSLRDRGLTYPQIAARVGCSTYTVRKRILEAEPVNHKVVSVEELCGLSPVYNGTVDETHSYFVHCGDNDAILSANCGEQFLLSFESCNLGSINLGNFIKQGRVDYDRLEEVVCAAVHFLDNVVDCTTFPIPEIEAATRRTRKLGLGVMGLHDMLIQMGMPYASEVGRAQAAEVMSFIQKVARMKSELLARERGVAQAFWLAPEEHCPAPQRANVTLTSIQPTGTVSMIADCSSGCEPYFSLVMVKNVMDGDRLLMVNKHFERVARAEGFYSEALMERVAERGTVVGDPEVPLAWQEVFRCAQDIGPMDHIEMQAVLQSHVDSGISKTINMPASATREEVRLAYVEAWRRGCKGLTVYRDGCRANQVLNVGKDKPAEVTPVVPAAAKAPAKLELPDVVDAKRYRLQGADGENMYIIVCTDNGVPVEVFAKFPADNRVELRDKSTMWTVTCRLASLALRHRVPMEEVIKQLDRSSGYLQDLPTQLAKLLKSFISDNGGEYSSACPDCGGRMVFQEGCETCAACGFSKCS